MKQAVGVFDLTNEQYHASEGISRSKLWRFKQLPSKYWHEFHSGTYEKPAYSDSFALGDVVHTMALEPTTFAERFIVAPHLDKRTKQGKAMYEEFLLEAQGKTVINADILHLASAMARELSCHKIVPDLLREAKFEKSIYWTHEPTGLLCKARPDVWQGRIVSDLKTTQDAGYRSFQMSAFKYGYFLQAAMIYESLKSIGEPFHNFVFICIEKTPPFSIGVYMLDDEALQFGLDQFNSLMGRLAECYEKNEWPDYGIQKLTIPNYATVEVTEHE